MRPRTTARAPLRSPRRVRIFLFRNLDEVGSKRCCTGTLRLPIRLLPSPFAYLVAVHLPVFLDPASAPFFRRVQRRTDLRALTPIERASVSTVRFAAFVATDFLEFFRFARNGIITERLMHL